MVNAMCVPIQLGSKFGSLEVLVVTGNNLLFLSKRVLKAMKALVDHHKDILWMLEVGELSSCCGAKVNITSYHFSIPQRIPSEKHLSNSSLTRLKSYKSRKQKKLKNR